MLVLPNKNKINTDNVIDLIKIILLESQGQTEFTDAKGWGTEEINAPDLITIDADGDFHIVHLIVAGDEGKDMDELEDMAKQVIKKKTCKKEATAFNKEFHDDIPSDASIGIDVVFLITMEGMEFGKLCGINRFDKKACELSEK